MSKRVPYDPENPKSRGVHRAGPERYFCIGCNDYKDKDGVILIETGLITSASQILRAFFTGSMDQEITGRAICRICRSRCAAVS